jgi:hypothetical protein
MNLPQNEPRLAIISAPTIHILVRHALEGLSKVLLAEGKLALCPDFGVLRGKKVISPTSQSHADHLRLYARIGNTYRLESLLDLSIQSTSLQSDDLGSRIGVVSNGRATLGAEDTVDGVTGAALASPALDGAVDGQLVLGNNSDQGYPLISDCSIGDEKGKGSIYSR